MTIDHDSAFKLLLTTFFVEFVDLFCPDLRNQIVPESVEFLPQEVFLDPSTAIQTEDSNQAEKQKRILDIAAKVRIRSDSPLAARGEEDVFIIVHVDPQSTRKANFERRMFRYFSRLHDRYNLPVYPIALFTFDAPTNRQPDRYSIEFPNLTVLDFRYQVVQLNQLSWRDYVNNPNPVACALMAKMDIAPADRPRVKFECLRLLLTLRLDLGKQKLISSFFDGYLQLTPQQAQQFEALVDTLELPEREEAMVLTTSWKEEGRLEGRVEGRAEGRVEGRVEGRAEGLAEGRQEASINIALQLLTYKFEALAPEVVERIRALNITQLEALPLAIFGFVSSTDLDAWLSAHQ
jgi:Domain of unknown function (DUF4351)